MIAEMNQTSKMVAYKVQKIEETFVTLQQKYLNGFKIKTEPLHQKRFFIQFNFLNKQLYLSLNISEN